MTRPAAFTAFGLFTTCCVMIFCAVAFAGAQAIWVDEATQLSGLTLGYREQALWLSGQIAHPFSVPADRMPPLSYWFGKLWASVFGLTEGSLRSLGIVMALCAMPALFLAGRLAGGLIGGLFAVAFLFTSPSFIIQTVEIRAYPIFFCLSAWASYFFVRIVTQEKASDDSRNMIALTAILVVMCYTHFYGVVMSGFVLAALLVACLSSGKSIKVLLICGAAGLLLVTGILPFVNESVSMTGAPPEDKAGLYPALADAARLAFRLVSSPVLFANPVALTVSLAGIVLLGLCLGFAVIRPQGMRSRKDFLIVVLVLVLGLGVLTLIRTQMAHFAVLAPHYNQWMLPLTSVAFAFAFALEGPWMRRIVRTAAVCIVASQLVGLATLMTHKTLYSHGASEAIADSIKDPATTLVIHDASGAWGHTYFPLSYLTEDRTTQWVSYPDGRYQRITRTGLLDIADPQTEKLSFKTILRAQTAYLDSQELSHIVRDPEACQLQPADLMSEASPENIVTFCAHLATSYTLSPARQALP